MDHQFFMQQASQCAKKGVKENKGGPFGACIVKDGQIISLAHNTVPSTNDPTAHAEVNAIRLACQKLGSYHLQGCILYTTCSPCPMCLAATYWARIDQLIAGVENHTASEFGFDDSKIFHEVRCEPMARQVNYKVGVCEQEIREVFQLWKDLNRTLY